LWGKTDFLESSLPNIIQLGLFFDRAREIAVDMTRRDFIYSEETRRMAQEIREGEERVWDRKNLAPQSQWLEKFWETAEVERASYFVYYPFEGEVGWIEPVYGKLDKVEDPLMEVFFQDAIPLIKFHTHRLESFFSPKDFGSLVISLQETFPLYEKVFKVPFPLCQAALLSSKDTWLLALRTNFSPLITISKWKEWTSEEKRECEDLISPFSSRFLKLGEMEIEKKQEYADTLIKRIVEPGEALEEMIKENRKFRIEIEAMERDQLKNLTEIVRIENERLLNFSRSLGLALYYSPEGINFQRFSA